MKRRRFLVHALALTGLACLLPGCGGNFLGTSNSSTGFSGDISNPFKLNGQVVSLTVGGNGAQALPHGVHPRAAGTFTGSATFPVVSIPGNLHPNGGTVTFGFNAGSNPVTVTVPNGGTLPASFQITSLQATALTIQDGAGSTPVPDLTLTGGTVTLTQDAANSNSYTISNGALTISGTATQAQLQPILDRLDGADGDTGTRTFTYTLNVTTAPVPAGSADLPPGTTLTLTFTSSTVHANLNGSTS